jgi:hypothetical protein
MKVLLKQEQQINLPITSVAVGKEIKDAKDKIILAKETIKKTDIGEPFRKKGLKSLGQNMAAESYIVPSKGGDYFNKEKVRVEGNYEIALISSFKELGFDTTDLESVNAKLNIWFDKAPIERIPASISLSNLVKNIRARVSITLQWCGNADVGGGRWDWREWADTYTFEGNYEQISNEVERVTEELVKINGYLSDWYEGKRNHFTLGYADRRTVAIMERRSGIADWQGMSSLRAWVKNNGLILRALKNAMLQIISQAISQSQDVFNNTITNYQNTIVGKLNEYNTYLTQVASSIREIAIKTKDDSLAKLTSSLSQSFKLIDESQKYLNDALSILSDIMNELKNIYAMLRNVKVEQIPDMETTELIKNIKNSVSYMQEQINKKLSDLEDAIKQIAQAIGA